jgi:hypothetical protein
MMEEICMAPQVTESGFISEGNGVVEIEIIPCGWSTTQTYNEFFEILLLIKYFR